MATFTKAQFKEQLKNPEVATIKRNIRLLRKIIRSYDWSVVSHHDKKRKCFELTLTPRSYDFTNYDRGWNAHNFNEVYGALLEIFRGHAATIVNDMGDIINASIPHNRPKV